jgi:hypothetical protein
MAGCAILDWELCLVELSGLEPLTPCLQIVVIMQEPRRELACIRPMSDRGMPLLTGVNGTLMAWSHAGASVDAAGFAEVTDDPPIPGRIPVRAAHSELAERAPSSRSQEMTFSCRVLSPLAASSGVPCA